MKKLIAVAAFALTLAACGESPTDTLTEEQFAPLSDNTSIMMLECQSDLVVEDMGKAAGEAYIMNLIERGMNKWDDPNHNIVPIQVQLWNKGYGPDGCEMFHPAFEGEE